MSQSSKAPRSAGVLIPLFSLRSERDWGVGELPDLGALAPWLSEAKLSILMLLPLNEVALGQDSPYSALSAFALDPLYLRLDDIPEFAELGGEKAMPEEDRVSLELARARPTVDYGIVRFLKERWLRKAFEEFRLSGAAAPTSSRGKSLEAFREEHRAWLPDYTLFRSLKQHRPHGSWRSWDAPLRDRQPEILDEARAETTSERAFREYLQWLAFDQLATARKALTSAGIRLAGDLPFLVGEDSADVWARQNEFRFDATVGVPPDAFSADGQDWGLPVYNWELIASGGYEWLKQRGQAAAQLFDLVRVDHVVGFYRTYVRPREPKLPHFFSPPDEPSQKTQGEAVMGAFGAGGVELVAEDLGTVPPFVRLSLTSLGIPGYRVMRWEKDGPRYRDPAAWPELSLATTGSHDNEPLAAWWDELEPGERRAVRELPPFRQLTDAETACFGAALHQAFLEAAYGSSSRLLVLPFQDLLGSRERVNVPGTMSGDNWSYRLTWPISAFATEPAVCAATARAAALAAKHRR